MDWTTLLRVIAEHGGSLGVLMTIFGLCVAAGTALGQWMTRSTFVAVTTELRNIVVKLDVVSSQLEAQQRIHEHFSESQRTHTEDLHRVAIELQSIANAIRDADVRRAEQLTALITSLITRRE